MHPPVAGLRWPPPIVAAASLLLCLAVVCHGLALAGDSGSARVRCLPKEREALLGFKRGVTGDPAGVLDSWRPATEPDCCRWRGVRCGNRTGRVLELRLRNARAGYYSYGGAPLSGQISRSLLALRLLRRLDLGWNHLHQGPRGGRVPAFLGGLARLQRLDLPGVPFVGAVPPQLGNLSRLRHLDLSYAAGLEASDLSWLARLPLLRYLNLRMADLGEVADWPLAVAMAPSLRVLDLSECSLVSANQSVPHHNLTNLQRLDLSWNYFDHPIASAWFWNVTSLEYLHLGSTSMHGRFPDALGAMASLRFLDSSGYADTSGGGIVMPQLRNLCSLEILNLGSSRLHGAATEVFESNLPRCSPNRLQELYLTDNGIHGSLPIWMGKLTSLAVLDLSQNNLTGHLPVSVGDLVGLSTLDLSRNRLTGHVSDAIAALGNLTNIVLSHNGFDGVVREDHFDGLAKLKYIDLSANSLEIQIGSEWMPPFRLWYADFSTCRMGPKFPAWLKWMVDITQLHISGTGIRDTIPPWFSSAFSNAIFLNVSQNELTGGLPADMEDMSIINLDLNSNQLTGPVPPLPKTIVSLDISMNSLSGPLPANFGVNLLELYLFSNRITGSVPESVCQSEGLTNIDLAGNLFEGELPQCFGNRAIVYLDVSNNSFSGSIPSSMQSCTELQVLDLSRNMFSGRLPKWIGKFTRLQFLRLSHNMFSGNIPVGITDLHCLQYMDMANNSISGSLPRDLSSLAALRQRYPAGFCSKDAITDDPSSLSTFLKGQQLNYGSIARVIYLNMKIIDLSLNSLTGEIPEEIATLSALVNLNLSQNHFVGSIPTRIGAIQSLESLDLSRNNLSGAVPSSLSNLTFLSYLDLSYNDLEGRIPSGSQLDTLYAANPTMYTGNVGLCGRPLGKNCSSSDASMEGHYWRRTEGYVSDFFYIGLGCGFVVGTWMVFGALLFKDGWRMSYFYLLDKLYDKIYVLFVVAWLRLRE